MTENFLHAANRHLVASETLVDEGQNQDAAYLAGYVAECAVKVFLHQTRMALLPRDFSHDLARMETSGILLGMLLSPRLGRYGAHFGRFHSLAWDPGERYQADAPSTGVLQQGQTDRVALGVGLLVEMALDGELEMKL